MIEIPLTQGQIALIDDEDYEIVSRYKWSARWSPCTNSFYAITNTPSIRGKRKTLLMHRLIMDAQPGQQADHINRLTLDNRKSELRLCTGSQNQHNAAKRTDNTSGYKGVSWHKRNKKWQARITVNGKDRYLGSFLTPELAHEAYCNAADELRGEFARVA